jgi:hypothetical protein
VNSIFEQLNKVLSTQERVEPIHDALTPEQKEYLTQHVRETWSRRDYVLEFEAWGFCVWIFKQHGTRDLPPGFQSNPSLN